MKTNASHSPVIESVPIADIRVLNPRTRDKGQHANITETIRRTGLRRPITVRRRPDKGGQSGYDLVCGQGRIEALTALGHTHVPAVVIEASEEDCLVMSLIENIARRSQSAIDTMREIGRLRDRGHSDVEIGELIGTSASWVYMVGSLLDKGEERLLVGVQTGLIPLSMAVDIAKASTPEIQAILNSAYEQGIRGKKMGRLRRLLESRAKRSVQMREGYHPPKGKPRTLSGADLRRMLEREAEKQRLLLKKAEVVHRHLNFCVGAMNDLLMQASFRELLKKEKLDSMPKMLSERMGSPS